MANEIKITKEEIVKEDIIKEEAVEKKQEVSKKYTVIAIRPTFVVVENSNGDFSSISSISDKYKIGDIIEL